MGSLNVKRKLLIDSDFEYLAGKCSNKLTEPSINNNLVEIANYLWLSENSNIALNRNLREDYIQFVVSEWQNPHPGIVNANPDIYTSSLALIYAALESIKNNYGRRELQQYLTQIKDFVFDNLLREGRLISSVNNPSVTPDELLSVWPFNLFSAEDLVLVQASEAIDNNYQNIDDYWKRLYIHYLISRSYNEKAQNLYDRLSNQHDNTGIQTLLKKRIEGLDSKLSKYSQEIEFQHSTHGNYNRYSHLEIERTPKNSVVDKDINIPVRVVSNRTINYVNLVVDDHDKTTVYPMKKAKDIWITSIKFKQIGNYSYHFEADDGLKINKSKSYPLIISEWINIRHMCLAHKTLDSMDVCIRDDHGNDFGIIRILISKKGIKLNLESDSFPNNTINDELSRISVGNINVDFSPNDESLNVKLKNGTSIFEQSMVSPSISILVTPEKIIKMMKIKLKSHKNEKFVGFGERYNSINQAGQVIDNYVFNQYRDQGIKTYMPMPLYISSTGYGLLISTSMYTKFDLTNAPLNRDIEITVEVNKKNSGFIYLTTGLIKEVLPLISQNTGDPEMIPTWAMGLWMSSNNWDRQSVVDYQLSMAKKENIPSTVFVLEQWSDEATYYMFNDSYYDDYHSSDSIKIEKLDFPSWGRWPDPKKMINNIHKDGMKLILWQIPILKEFPPKRNQMLDDDKKYAIRHHYIVLEKNGEPYFIPEGWFTNALVWDPTKKESRDWWFSKRQYLLDMGVDGFKTDGGECIFGDDLKFSDGTDGSMMRNQYPISYIGAYYDFLKQKKGITFSRSGYLGAQTMPAHWAGDERSTFAAFKRSLKAGINAGLSGLIFWGWDFSGFNGEIPTSELYLRSTEMATFVPIMQYHAESKAQYNQDRTPWNIQSRTGDKSVIPIFRKYANLRMNLLPYIFDESSKAVKTRLPLMKALYMEYQDDIKTIDCFDEYLFGEGLLVAPVITEGATNRDIYLPKGIWCNFFDNKIEEGNQVIKSYPANIDKIPVFIRENKGILMNTHNNKIMSDVGNNIEKYDQPLLKIFVVSSFEQTIVDHLGHKTHITSIENKDGVINLQVETEIPNLNLKVISKKKINKTIQYNEES